MSDSTLVVQLVVQLGRLQYSGQAAEHRNIVPPGKIPDLDPYTDFLLVDRDQ